jgi:hypothetical protein
MGAVGGRLVNVGKLEAFNIQRGYIVVLLTDAAKSTVEYPETYWGEEDNQKLAKDFESGKTPEELEAQFSKSQQFLLLKLEEIDALPRNGEVLFGNYRLIRGV